MAAGSRTLRKLQLGDESVQGTPVAASAIWRGRGTILDRRDVVHVEEDVGVIGGTDRSYIARIWSELELEEVEATFEQLPYLFEMGVSAETPTQDGAGSDYIYNYLAPTTAKNTIKTYTFEGGDDIQAEEFDYGYASEIVLSGEGQGALMMAAAVRGRETTNTTFTGGLTLPSVEEILFNSGKLYIDDSGGTVGSTQVSDLLLGMNLTWNTGLQHWWAVDGSLDWNRLKQVDDEIILELTYEHTSDAVTEKGKYRSNDVRLMRLLFEGSDVASAGTTYSKKTLIIDLSGTYEEWSNLDENEGNDIVTATLRVRQNDTDSLKADVTIVNELSALP